VFVHAQVVNQTAFIVKPS